MKTENFEKKWKMKAGNKRVVIVPEKTGSNILLIEVLFILAAGLKK
jgi:hypothetical protein